MTPLPLLCLTGAAGLVAATLVAPPASAAPAPEPCFGKTVTITATENGQVITGTDGPDVVRVADRFDVTVSTGAGDDRICVSQGGSVTVDAGDGDDRVKAWMTPDGRFDAGAGDDVLDGTDVDMVAGPGDDAIDINGGSAAAGPGDDTLRVLTSGVGHGDAGDDELTAFYYSEADVNDGPMVLRGDEGDDLLTLSRATGNDADGGAGRDVLSLAELRAGAVVDLADGTTVQSDGSRRHSLDLARTLRFEDVVGTPFDDRLYGDRGVNHLVGGGGDDLMRGGGGRDRLRGGKGRDTAYGDGGRDRCEAEVRRSC